jgi:lipopolysaccharide/colanic/teichoic acid biosynthesis glycosyltransferase
MSESVSTRVPRKPVARRGHETGSLPPRVAHDIATFRQILDHERARTDRSGQPFTVVVIQGRDASNPKGALESVAEFLATRLRNIDEFGWMPGGRLAALLPYTSVEGAWKVADDIVSSGDPDSAPPLCEVFEYPSNWPEPHQDEPPAEDGLEEPRPGARQLEPEFQQNMPIWKRLMDIAGAIVGLCLLSPLFLVVALLIKLTSKGPVFFSQWRTGHGGRRIRMYKFRSMVVDAEAKKALLLKLNEQDGPAFKMKNDPRVTWIGHYIRKTSIDELPQLWNVLLGDMTIVGPRPLPCSEMEECETWQRRRLDVMPGLTCIWQVRGRSQVRFAEWCRMDMEYIRTRSLWMDLKLFVLTLPAVLFKHTGK